MDEDKNKAAVIRYYSEAWNKGNIAVIDEVFHPDYIVDNPPPWRKPGAEGLKEFVKDNHRMFPDVQSKIEDIIAEGDKVVARVSFTGTHKGDLVGPVGLVPATNKQVTFRGIFIFLFENGKVAKTWNITDNMELMQQLGAIPKPN